MFCWFPAAILVDQNGTPIWRLHTKLYKGAWNVSANNSETVGHKDLRLGQIVYILVFCNMSFSRLLPLDGFQFIFCCVTAKTIYNRTTVARHEGGGKKNMNKSKKKKTQKQTNKLQYVTVKRLDCSNVIRVELHAFHVPCVVRVHDSTLNIRMINTEWVTKFVSGNPKQVSSFWGVVSKLFVFVKVGTAIRWKERMRQNSTLTIERVCARSFTWTAMSSSAKTVL